VDAIVTPDTATARAAHQATRTIPIVMGAGGDPVEAGLVTSLARPGGNLTGFTLAVDAAFAGRQLQLLKELAARVARVVVIHQTSDYARFRNTQEAGVPVRSFAQFADALAWLRAPGVRSIHSSTDQPVATARCHSACLRSVVKIREVGFPWHRVGDLEKALRWCRRRRAALVDRPS
jgi:hypothetical protein